MTWLEGFSFTNLLSLTSWADLLFRCKDIRTLMIKLKDCVNKYAVQLALKQCNSLPKWTFIDKHNDVGKLKWEYHQNIKKFCQEKYKWPD